MTTTSEHLEHHGVKGMKWGVRKAAGGVDVAADIATGGLNPGVARATVDAGSSAKASLQTNRYVQLAKGTKEGNIANLAVTAASVGALAASAPISAPIMVGSVVSARVLIKSYEAYRIFYEKHPSKLLPKPTAAEQAKYSVGRDMRQQLEAKHGKKTMKQISKP